jgi:hypothetical protein
MNNKFKIIEVSDYVLAVSDGKIKESNWYENNGVLFLSDNIFDEGNNPNQNKNNRLVIAYQLKGNAPELDLPPLPEIVVEDDVEKLWLDFNKNHNRELPLGKEQFIRAITYKSATKVYSEDDLIDFSTFRNGGDVNKELQLWKSLKQPKWFVSEMEGCDNCINHQGQHLSPDCCHNYKLKTTKINGKTYLIGKFTH